MSTRAPGKPWRPAGRCARCWQQGSWCLCDQIPSVETSLSLVIVRHWKEIGRGSNSGRMAALAMPSLQLLDWGEYGRPFDPTPLTHPGTWLLFPDAYDHGGHPLPEGRAHRGLPAPTPERVVLVDASWAQARKMVGRITQLGAMPRFVLPGPAHPPPRLRRSPSTDAMATLEAIAALVRTVDGPQRAVPLDALFAALVRANRGQRGRLSERPTSAR